MGKSGIERCEVLTADELAQKMITAIVSDLKLEKGDEIALMINGFGGSPLSELYLLNHSVIRELKAKNISVCKILVGTI